MPPRKKVTLTIEVDPFAFKLTMKAAKDKLWAMLEHDILMRAKGGLFCDTEDMKAAIESVEAAYQKALKKKR